MKNMQNKNWKWMSLEKFCKENFLSWVIVGAFLLITYGIKVFNVSISHDTEAIMTVPESLYNSWYSMGRFGLIALKKILGTYLFNPYAASALMVIVIFLNIIFWTFLFSNLGGEKWSNKYTTWIFPVVFFTSMIVAEQNGFLLQVYEVNIGLLFVCFALLFTFKGILGNKNKFFYIITSIFCCIIAFSTYQTLVPLFAAAAAFCFMLVYDACLRDNGYITAKFCWSLIGKLVCIFIISFLTYSLINKCILGILNMETTSYITEQIMWGKIPVSQGVKNICIHIYKALMGKRIFYSLSFFLVYLGMFFYTVRVLLKKYTCSWIYALAVVFVLCSPFFMTVLMGNEPTIRTQLILPFVAGVGFQYLVNKARNISVFYPNILMVIIVFVGFICLHQSMDSARLYYTQYVQYEEDVRVAEKISTQIEQLGLGENPEEPVVFVGWRVPQKNSMCYEGNDLELIGRSFFEVCFSTMHGSTVINHFMDTLGYSYIMPSQEQCDKAQNIAQTMENWPNDGSVIEKEGIIIVKL